MGGETTKVGPPRWIVRIATILVVNVAVTAVLLEASARIAARVSPRIATLLYIPELASGSRYKDIQTLEELVDSCPCKFFGPYYNSFGYILNSRSLRTHEYTVAKPPGVRRTVLLGDSFFFDNAGVPDRFHIATVLDDILAMMGPSEVINLSLPCVGPKFSLRMWEIEGRRLSPDVVIFGLFVGNDLIDEPVELPDPSLASIFTRDSYVFRLGRNLMRLRGAQRSVPIAGNAASGDEQRGGFNAGFEGSWPPEVPPIETEEFYRIQMSKYVMFETEWNAHVKRQWRSVKNTLLRMQQIAEVDGTRFMLLVIPDQVQVSTKLQEMMQASFPDLSFDFAKPQRKIVAFAERMGIESIDLLPPFREAKIEGERLFAVQDTHWNPRGQRLAAEQLARKIRRRSSRSNSCPKRPGTASEGPGLRDAQRCPPPLSRP